MATPHTGVLGFGTQLTLAPDSSSLVILSLEYSSDDSNNWVPASDVGDLREKQREEEKDSQTCRELSHTGSLLKYSQQILPKPKAGNTLQVSHMGGRNPIL